jgi:hypothetical protein
MSIFPISVPESLNLIWSPPASSVISVAQSITKSSEAVIVSALIVSSSTVKVVRVPKLVIAD